MFPVQCSERIIDNGTIRIEFSLWHKRRIFHQSDILANYLFTLISPLFFCDIFDGILLNHTRARGNKRTEDLFFVIKILSDRTKYPFVFFLLPLFPVSIVLLLRNNICYTYLLISIRDFVPIPIPFLFAVHRLLSILALSFILLPFYLLFHSLLIPPFDTFSLFSPSVLVNSYILVFPPPNFRSYASLIFSSPHKFLFPFFVPFSENQQALDSSLLLSFKKIRKSFLSIYMLLFSSKCIVFFTVSILASIDPFLSPPYRSIFSRFFSFSFHSLSRSSEMLKHWRVLRTNRPTKDRRLNR